MARSEVTVSKRRYPRFMVRLQFRVRMTGSDDIGSPSFASEENSTSKYDFHSRSEIRQGMKNSHLDTTPACSAANLGRHDDVTRCIPGCR
jgi:hypothetical protein